MVCDYPPEAFRPVSDRTRPAGCRWGRDTGPGRSAQASVSTTVAPSAARWTASQPLWAADVLS
ncbi:hypothetical protein GCM10009629_33880 [Pseudonocardia alni]